MLQDNKCVLNCLYFYIRIYTDVFYMYCILFCFNFYVYISVRIYVFILVLIVVFFVSNLMYCFYALSEMTKWTSYIYIVMHLQEFVNKWIMKTAEKSVSSLHWRHNDHGGVSNQQPHGCLLNRLFRRRSKKTSKLRVTGLCAGNSPGPVNSPPKGPVTQKMVPFDDVIMVIQLPDLLTINSD